MSLVCPNCGAAVSAFMLPIFKGCPPAERVCPGCSELLLIRITRRGRVEVKIRPQLLRADGTPLPSQSARQDHVTVPNVALAPLRPGVPPRPESLTSRKKVELPIYWAPKIQEAHLLRLADGACSISVVCRCPKCGKRLTSLWWPRARGGARSDPPFGVVVIDTRLRGWGEIARLGAYFRQRWQAAALLVCRRCRTATAFTFREPRSLRAVPLDALLPDSYTFRSSSEPKPGSLASG